MSSSSKHAVAVAAMAVLASVSAQAVPVNGGPYFAGLAVVGTNGGATQVQGPQLSWNCIGDACTFSGALRASVVFQPTIDAKVDITYLLAVAAAAPVALVDPLGHTVGYYKVDIGKWRFQSVADNEAAPAGSIFMSAYGHNEINVDFHDQDQDYSYHDLQLMSGGQISTASATGPGSSSAEDTPVAVFTRISASVITPYYAFPSTTNPRCASFSCLQFGGGQLESVRFALSFDLVQVAAPVPEPGTLWTLLAGLGLSAVYVSRRKAR